eukprot:m51a1_g12562 hypothetical protein (597) ;mRNA; r:751-3826
MASRPTRVKVALLGDQAVGKSSLVSRARTGRFDEQYVPTTFVDGEDVKLGDAFPGLALTLWDMSGSEQFESIRPLSYIRTRVFVVCYSVGSPASLDRIVSTWSPELRSLTAGTEAQYILAATKADLRAAGAAGAAGDAGRQCVQRDRGVAAAQQLGYGAFVETSSRTGEGVRRLLGLVVQLSGAVDWAAALAPGAALPRPRKGSCDQALLARMVPGRSLLPRAAAGAQRPAGGAGDALELLTFDAWELVFEFLRMGELGAVARVCRAFRAASSTDAVWRRFLPEVRHPQGYACKDLVRRYCGFSRDVQLVGWDASPVAPYQPAVPGAPQTQDSGSRPPPEQTAPKVRVASIRNSLPPNFAIGLMLGGGPPPAMSRSAVEPAKSPSESSNSPRGDSEDQNSGEEDRGKLRPAARAHPTGRRPPSLVLGKGPAASAALLGAADADFTTVETPVLSARGNGDSAAEESEEGHRHHRHHQHEAAEQQAADSDQKPLPVVPQGAGEYAQASRSPRGMAVSGPPEAAGGGEDAESLREQLAAERASHAATKQRVLQLEAELRVLRQAQDSQAELARRYQGMQRFLSELSAGVQSALETYPPM